MAAPGEEGWLSHQGGKLDAPGLQQQWSNLDRPARILVSNVAGDEAATRLAAVVGELWGLTPNFAATLANGYGVSIAYDNPKQLGVDRWLAMIAAFNTAKTPVLVVDCGTAVTLDAIDQRGKHLGGVIAPGMAMMWDSLFSRTRIPGVEQKIFNGPLGTNTAQCVAAGAQQSVAGLIERVYRQLPGQSQGNWQVLLTGGDAGRLVKQLNLPVELRPQLVFEGLDLL